MAQDRFFQQIFVALGNSLDPKVFEACACELVRLDFPGVVPVPGGQDAGMDGAIPDFDGEAFPLVCTTGEDVIRNLTGSLDSYLAKNGRRRQAIFVTSQSLTPTRRRNLEERAREKGFSLVNIYERQAVAERLYRSPRWCKDLLNLTGEPPALSKIPPNPRVDIGNALLGRDEDLAWLRGKRTDCILTGQPGSGKTHLLKHLVSAENAYFLTGSGNTEIATAVRELTPDRIIIDDAHAQPEQVANLQRIRRELGASFQIITVAWPNSISDFKIQMSVGSDSCRELRLLNRDEIVSVIKSCSLVGPDQLIHEIVNQAEGKPGLAVLLSSLCLSGDIRKFWTGNLLSDWVLYSLSQVTEQKPQEILASFALGGESGMNMASVAGVLGLPLVQVRRIVADLAAAGILTEVQESLSVRPPALRYALVRDVFFSGPTAIDPAPLYAEVKNEEELAYTIVNAAHRGASIPEHVLLEKVVAADSERVWGAFAWLGKLQTLTVIDGYPERDQYVVEPALEFCPERILPRLFEKAINDDRPLNAHPNHPLRKVQDWISNASPDTGEAIEKKGSLLTAISQWIDAGKEPSVAYKVLPNVFSVSFEQNSLDPGAGNTFQLRHGVLAKEDIEKLRPLWEKCFQLLTRHQTIQWKAVINAVEMLVYIGRHRVKLSADTVQVAKDLATKMLTDLGTISGSRPGVVSKLVSLANDLGASIQFATDPVFEKLFPGRELLLESREEVVSTRMEELAEQWKERAGSDVASDLKRIEAEAKIANINWPRLTPQVCYKLAEKVRDPLAWASCFLSADLPSDLIVPFAGRAMLLDQVGWQEFAQSNLTGRLRPHLVELVLLHPAPPEQLLEKVLGLCDGYGGMIEHLVGRVPEATLARLLKHPDSKVRGHVAIGEWNAGKRGQLREGVRDLWRSAIIGFGEDEYWLKEILPTDADLAFNWIAKRFEEGERISFDNSELIGTLCPILSVDQRRALLKKLPNGYFARELILDLVQDDSALSAEVLASKEMKDLHLYLAEWRGGGSAWETRVTQLLDAGYSIEDVGGRLLPSRHSWWGKESEMWKSQLATFQPLQQHPNEQIRRIGNIVTERVQRDIDRALKFEEHEAIYGRRR